MVAAQTGRGVVGIDILILDGVPVVNRVDKGHRPKSGHQDRASYLADRWKDLKELTAQLQTSLAARNITEECERYISNGDRGLYQLKA